MATWANLATTIRVLCIAAMVVCANNPKRVFVFALVGGLSDGLDGYLARRFDQSTEFGKRFDQYADWGFGVAAMYCIYMDEQFTLCIGFYLGVRLMRPFADTTAVAKAKTVVQFSGAVLILGGHAYQFVPGIIFGYGLVYLSLWLMLQCLLGYFNKQP
jgi:cardiolipin synthase